MEAPLLDGEKQTLLRFARQALYTAAHNQQLPPLDLDALTARLRAPGASFITLTKDGQLRGCIGTLQKQFPLAEDVRQHAIDAALHDYRFASVQPEEVDQIEIEVSVLTTPQPLEYSQPEDLPHLLRPDVDGVILIQGAHRATFLPQVWSKVPDAEIFLDMLCEKALLPRGEWRQVCLEILTYQVECFHETISG
ncbi:MAG: AmmeMemoRadiSam system protein A [Anaerolineales bacterium]|nr:MAG: AmmeMemoRadiSam system protein A [Anaerolineales bacterium]